MMFVSIIGRMADLDSVIDICMKGSDFHPEKAIDYLPRDSGYTQLTEENPYQKSLEHLQELAKTAKLRPAPVDYKKLNMDDGQILEYVDKIYRTLNNLNAQRKLLSDQVALNRQSIEHLTHFKGYDLNLGQIFQCQYTKVRFGRIPNDSYEKIKQYDSNPYVVFVPCASDENYHWGVYFSPLENAAEVDRIFGNLYFERLRLPDSAGTVEDAIDEYQAAVRRDEQIVKDIDDQLDEIWKLEYDRFEMAYAFTIKKFKSFSMRSYAARYNDFFYLMLYVPQKRLKGFEARIGKIEAVEYTVQKPDVDSPPPPVQLHNNALVRPYEMYVEMYGLPSYYEIDPTSFVAFTYSLFFGLMFADLGQGLLVILAGFLMSKLKGMKLGNILMRCGVFSCIFGTLFGSFFGFEHALDNILFKNVFGLSEKPIEVMSPNNIVGVIGAAIGIGVVLVVVAMLLNIYSSLRRRDYEAALFGNNGVAGLLFYVCTILGVVLTMLTDIKILNPLYVIFLIILPLLAVFFREPLGKLVKGRRDWLPKKMGEYIVQNFFELFEMILSYLTNTMSFLRVGAFVLVHAGMMLVVFTLADTVGGVGYWIVVVVGNLFVSGMEGLLVGIQSLRLEFYEMFSRFYEGDGKPFTTLEEIEKE